MSKSYIIDICVGYACNFRCSYCFQKHSDLQYKYRTLEENTIERICEYIKYLASTEDKNFVILFYGGEPLIFLDKVLSFVEKLKDVEQIKMFGISTNGSLVLKHKNDLLKLKNMIAATRKNKRLCVMTSYDYCLQKNRKDGTYQIVRDGITWLNDNDFYAITNSVLSNNDDLSNFYEMVKDFMKLKMRCPNLYMKFNFNMHYNDSAETYDNFKKSLIKIKHLLNKLDLGYHTILYNITSGTIHERLEECFAGRLYLGFDINGDMYPSWNVIFEGKDVSKMLYIANVEEDFDVIKQKHEDLRSKINFELPEQCKSCNFVCRTYPWVQVKTSLNEWSNVPEQPHCFIRELLYNNFYIE